MTPDDFATRVRSYALHFNASETSGQRSPARNIAVGGVDRSPHLVGQGRDVAHDAQMPLEWLQRVRARLGETWSPRPLPPLSNREAIARSFGLRVVAEDDHDHLQPLDWP